MTRMQCNEPNVRNQSRHSQEHLKAEDEMPTPHKKTVNGWRCKEIELDEEEECSRTVQEGGIIRC